MTPWTFDGPLRTERLLLRPLTDGDIDDVLAWMSDPEIVRYQLYEPRSREQVAEHVAKATATNRIAERGDWVEFGIELEGRIIGIIYFSLASVDDETAEIGWALTAGYHGKGFAMEAASAVLDLAFGAMGLHRVYAELDPRNTASVTLCERLGMRHEGHLVEHMMFKGEWADTGIYGILDREWAARA